MLKNPSGKGHGCITLISDYHNGNSIFLPSEQLRSVKCCNSGQMKLEGDVFWELEEKEMCIWGNIALLELINT